MTSAPVSRASVARLSLMRVPRVSSIHMRAPPAPQQKLRFPLRSISWASVPGSAPMSSRGGANTLLCRPRKLGSWYVTFWSASLTGVILPSSTSFDSSSVWCTTS